MVRLFLRRWGIFVLAAFLLSACAASQVVHIDPASPRSGYVGGTGRLESSIFGDRIGLHLVLSPVGAGPRRVACAGPYDFNPVPMKITVPLHCSDGTTGFIIVDRLHNDAKSGIAHFRLADGANGYLYFGSVGPPPVSCGCGFPPAHYWLLFFSTDSSSLSQVARSTLSNCVRRIKQHHPAPISIAGNTDRAGSAAFDRALGLRRAEAVADFLAAHGVDRSLMKVVSHGSTQPLGGKPSPPLHEKINRNVIVTIQFQHYRGQH